MEFSLKLDGEYGRIHIANIKNFIERSDIEGLEKLDVGRVPLRDGEMGGGMVLDTVTGIINAASAPLTQLVKCLQTYFQTFKTDIDITVGGKTIKINTSHPERTQELVKLILTAT